MARNARQGFYIVLAVAALFLTWPHALVWMREGGNILNPASFFADAVSAGGTAAFLAYDLLVVWIIFMVWVIEDSKRVGLGIKWGWIFLFLSFIALSMAFPLYLLVRERQLDARRVSA